MTSALVLLALVAIATAIIVVANMYYQAARDARRKQQKRE